MGGFDVFAENLKADAQGRWVYFPRGLFGRGYILRDESQRELLQQAHRRWTKLYAIVLFCLIITHIPWYVYLLVGLPLSFLQYLHDRKMLKGPEISQERLTLRESWHNGARSLGPVASVFFFLASFLMLVMSLASLWRDRGWEAWAVCVILVGCTLTFGYAAFMRDDPTQQ